MEKFTVHVDPDKPRKHKIAPEMIQRTLEKAHAARAAKRAGRALQLAEQKKERGAQKTMDHEITAHEPKPPRKNTRIDALREKLQRFDDQEIKAIDKILTSGSNKDVVALLRLMWEYKYGKPKEEAGGGSDGSDGTYIAVGGEDEYVAMLIKARDGSGKKTIVNISTKSPPPPPFVPSTTPDAIDDFLTVETHHELKTS